MVDYYRDTWAEINLDAVAANVENMKAHLAKDVQIMAVVKADGYGHGAVQTAQTALASGASWLGVALLDEAIALRQAGIRAPILVLGWTRPSDITLAERLNISLTVFQKEWMDAASAAYKGKAPVFIHLKCDTGMGRLGVRSKEEMTELIKAIKSDPRFIVEGAYTHFATADETDRRYFDLQYTRFEEMLGWLETLHINPNIIHCGNSAAALKHPSKMFNLIRFGIAMYGLSPSLEMKPDLPFPLQEAFALRSRLVHVKKIAAGEAVSYGATFKAEAPTWIGTIPIGYADGWLRRLSGKASVLVSGRRMPIVGRICMDQMMCQLDQAYPVGEAVTLIGEADGQAIPIDEIAGYLETINYEVPCMISKRVPRLYFKNGKKIHMTNSILNKLDINCEWP